MYKAYPAIFHVAENGGYWVEFLDLPGCVSEGASLAQAAAEAVDALGGYLCAMYDGFAAGTPCVLRPACRARGRRRHCLHRRSEFSELPETNEGNQKDIDHPRMAEQRG